MTPSLQPFSEDLSARRRALDTNQSFVVQAPAGSGKTELLIQRYLALLGKVDEPECILAITFTKKAAAEMRARVLQALRSVDEEPPPEGSNARFTRDLAIQALAQERRRSWELLANPARLRIQTIDAFCVMVARRMPWLARFGAMPEFIEDASEMYREAARRTLALLGEPGAWADAMATLLTHVDNDASKVLNLLVSMLAKRDQWLRHVARGVSRTDMEAALARVFAADLAKLAQLAPELSHSGSAAEWQAVAEALLTKGGTLRKKNLPAWASPSLQNRAEFLRRLADVAKLPEPRYDDVQWQVTEAVLKLLPVAVAQLKTVFQERAEVDFPELQQAAQYALGSEDEPTDLAMSLGHRIEHILVDEMQDTSAGQMALLRKLTALWEPGDARTIFLVGDPMQSIYKFREAEVGLFLRLQHHGLPQAPVEPLTLRANFRSRPEIVDWANAAFSEAFPREEDIATGAVTYSASAAAREASREVAVRVHPIADDDTEGEARLVADLVEQSITGSTAILVRARTHLPPILAELKLRGIRFRALDIDPLTSRPVITDLLALTRALLHPADRTAWLAILRAPWCGLTLDELYRIASGDAALTIWDRVQGTSEPIRRFREVISRALAEVRRIPLRTCVERAWIALGGPAVLPSRAELDESHRFFDLLDSLDNGGSISSFAALERALDELHAAPDPSAPEKLQIMTIHKAKGLEFDTVILPGLSKQPRSEEHLLLRWAEVPLDGGDELLLAPMKSAEAKNDLLSRYLKRLDSRKELNETARLLYVAATRAKEKLHLLAQPKMASGSLAQVIAGTLKQEFAEVAAPVRPIPELLTTRRPLRRLPEKWQPPTPPPDARAAIPEAIASRDPVTFEWAGQIARQVGIVVHGYLQRLARGASLESCISTAHTALAAEGVTQSDRAQAAERVAEALRGIMNDPRGQWILERRSEDGCEVSFDVETNGVVQTIRIDRTFVDEDGVRWIIDYKTGVHTGGNIDEFLDHEWERYRTQLETYAQVFQRMEQRPIKMGLYFPLIKGWRAASPSAFVRLAGSEPRA
jgi:ATP-dependent exoDNAse (exonuclease V) beta subunit